MYFWSKMWTSFSIFCCSAARTLKEYASGLAETSELIFLPFIKYMLMAFISLFLPEE